MNLSGTGTDATGTQSLEIEPSVQKQEASGSAVVEAGANTRHSSVLETVTATTRMSATTTLDSDSAGL